MLKFRLQVRFKVNNRALLAGTDDIGAQSDATPEEDSGVTEEKEIDYLRMQMPICFFPSFLNSLHKVQKNI